MSGVPTEVELHLLVPVFLGGWCGDQNIHFIEG